MRWTYQTDAYRPTLDTKVRAVVDGAVALDDTVFHPAGGGQPGDSGQLVLGELRWKVVETVEDVGGLLHRLEAGSVPPAVGSAVRAEVDWARRYRFMRYHTALHLLSGVVFQRFGSGITGNQIGEGGARMDFSIPEFGRPLAEELIEATNAVAERALPVEVRFISPEERARRPELVRVANDRRPEGAEVRLIDIVGFDVQADGGTHVHATKEVGPLRLDRIENKGARNKRLYITLEDREPPSPAPSA